LFWSGLRTIRFRQLALACSGWLTLLGVEYLPAASISRMMLVFFFVLVCPGLAVARILPMRESAERWVLAVALSISFGLMVSVGFTIMRNDSITSRLASLALIITLAVLVDVAISWRGRVRFEPAEKKALR
jgi:uncharacterized membrane protein